MKLQDIVKALIADERISISDDELVETVRFLICDSVCHKPKTLFKIGKLVNDAIEYEKD